jgi:acyl-CoA synthetase (AMP-forming)/AMP-acid ligase II
MTYTNYHQNLAQEYKSLLKSDSQVENIIESLLHRAKVQPDQTAYTFLKNGDVESSSLTYVQLAQQAQAIAATLQDLNAAGQFAILLYPPGLEFVAAFLGCLLAGVVAIPASPPRRIEKTSKLEAILLDSQAAYVLTTSAYVSSVKPRLGNEEFSNRLNWIVSDRLDLQRAAVWQEPTIDLNSISFLQYTSGSTGSPKGVVITHNNLLQNHRALKLACIHPDTATFVNWLPLFHDMGLIGNVLLSLVVGKHCVFMPPASFIQKPIRWLQAISRYKGVLSGGPNFAYDLICNHVTPEQRAEIDLSQWRVAFCGAEPIRAATVERVIDLYKPHGFNPEIFYPCYGMAEGTLFLTGGNRLSLPSIRYVNALALEKNKVVTSRKEASQTRAVVGCGHPWLDTKLVIVNPETLARCPDAQVGEIWVAGETVAKSYLGKPEETAQTFNSYLRNPKEGPFLRTGDLGFIQDGELFVTGRLKEIMIFSGLNRYPQHIEQSAEKSHPALRPNCGAAFSINDDGRDQLVIVYEVERSMRRKLEIDEIVQSVCWAVARDHYVNVSAILLLKPGTLPKTSSGKIQHRACRSEYLEGTLAVIEEWRAPPDQPDDFKWLLKRYLNPVLHATRYWINIKNKSKKIFDKLTIYVTKE